MQIHQMLHGYNQGHNLIQGSLSLSSNEDMDCIATLSDWSEYINSQDDADYITAYPLNKSEYYVIAKTWYASEMKRPGCVWTHSILIPFRILNQITDYRFIIDLFVRPQDDSFESYSIPIKIDLSTEYRNPQFTNKLPIQSLSIIYNELINQRPIVYSIESKSHFYQYLCILLMNYFPSQLLRQLSFSSGSSSLRILENKPFSLQFINAHNDYVKSLFHYDEVELESIPSWVKLATHDISLENIQLTRLLHAFSDDIADNFKRFNGFLILIELVNKPYKTHEEKRNGMQFIIAELASLFPHHDDGLLLKERFLQQQITDKFIPDDEFLYLMCISEFINSFSLQTINFWQRIQAVAKNNDRQLYYLLLKRLCQTSRLNDWGENVLKRSNENLTASDLDSILEKDWGLYQSLVSICPELLNQCSLAVYSREQLEDILRIILIPRVSEMFKEWRGLLIKVLELQISVHTDLSSLIFQKDEESVNYVLDYLNVESTRRIPSSIEILCQKNSDKILNWMERTNIITHNIAFLIMESIQPTSQKVQSKGSDCWISFSKLSTESMPTKYYMYLYLLSFNWLYDNNAIMFMQKSFYPLHKALSEGQLDYDIWKRISPYTEELPLWHDWDRCKKLRKAVVKRIKKSSVPKRNLYDFTPDKELNKELIKIWEK